jgi:hypothetical protein
MGPHGIGVVYDDLLILEATRRRLERTSVLKIPADNRELVEITTHPEVLDELAGALGEPWEAHRRHIVGSASAERGLARLNLVDRTQPFGVYEFDDGELAHRIATRLGESDRRIRFPEPFVGPFGKRVRELNVPGWLVRDVPKEPVDREPTDVKGCDGGATFSFGAKRLRYDRLGLRADCGG